MRIAREGEEIVCPRGTLNGRVIHNVEDQISDGDFSAPEARLSADGQHYLCACCERVVAVREDCRWRVHLRRGWVR
jgi:hypothetical protein